MMRRWIPTVALCVVVLTLHNPVLGNSQYKYVDAEGFETSIVVDEGGDTLGLVKHALSITLDRCADTTFCYKGESLALVLPDIELELGLNWLAAGHVFKAIDQRVVGLAGTNYCVWVITSHPNGVDFDKSTFFFSETSELIGFSIPGIGQLIDATTGEPRTVLIPQTYWLASEIGLRP